LADPSKTAVPKPGSCLADAGDGHIDFTLATLSASNLYLSSNNYADFIMTTRKCKSKPLSYIRMDKSQALQQL
jgi:hypothetical protein